MTWGTFYSGEKIHFDESSPKIVRMHGSESFGAILEPPRESELDCCHDPAKNFHLKIQPYQPIQILPSSDLGFLNTTS